MRQTRQPISFRQLCLLAREQLRQDPTIAGEEWKARIQDRAHAIGYLTPWPEEVHRAMDAVEYAETRLGRRRPATRQASFEDTGSPRPRPVPRTIKDLPPEIRQMVEPVMRIFGAGGSRASAISTPVSTDPTQVQAAIKHAIDEFWSARSATSTRPWCAHCRAVCGDVHTCPECNGAPVCETCFKELRLR